MINYSHMDVGLNEFGNINRTSLNDYVPWPLWEQILGITYYFAISVIGIIGTVLLFSVYRFIHS
jgi:succinate dehydrogenase hydrophobic anchor subunit